MNFIVPREVKGTSMMKEMDKMVNSFFGNYAETNQYQSFRSPVVDIKNLEKEYLLTAELPGLTEKDIDIKVEENLLTVSTQKNEAKEEEKSDTWLLKERKNSAFKRSFYLPKDADVKKIKATFKEGLLTLNIEKREDAKPFNIKIN